MAQAAEGVRAPQRTTGRGRLFTLGVLTLGHSATHWYNQGFFVILTAIKEQLGLSATAAGVLAAVRGFSGAVVNVPAGVVTDLFRSRWNLILALSLVWIGLSSVLVGVSPSYVFLLFTVALLGIGGTTWHMPAIASLSQRFPDRKGLALSTHGVGGNAGDALAPYAFGLLLLVFMWRDVLLVTAAAPIVLGVLVYFLLPNLGQGTAGGRQEGEGIGSFLASVGAIFRNRLLIMLAVMAGVRTMAQTALTPYLAFYLNEELGFSSDRVGLYVTLLTALGVVSSPVLGILSDRMGRKPVLLAGMTALGALSIALAHVSPGWQLVAVIAAMGVFLYSLQAIVVAGAMDLAGERAAATTVGLMFTGNRLFSAASPIFAGMLVDLTGAYTSAFYYTGAMMLLAGAILLFMPLRKVAATSPTAVP